MSLVNFIPAVWAARGLVNLHKAHVYGNPLVINRDYEGDIQDFGDTVKINAIGAVTVRPYTRNTDISAPDTLDSAQTNLTIDQSSYFNFAVDDLDKAQTRPEVMDLAMYEAGYAMADSSDQYIASLVAGNVAALNTIGTAAAPMTNLATASAAYGYLVLLGQRLNEASIPQAGRWLIIPPWFYAYIQKDPNFIHSTTAADIMLRTGRLELNIAADMSPGLTVGSGMMPTTDTFVGYIAGFACFMSNNVPNTASTSYQILAGHAIAWSFAEQLVKVEGYRPQLRFGDAVKGLHVYGAKVTRPNALGLLYANPT